MLARAHGIALAALATTLFTASAALAAMPSQANSSVEPILVGDSNGALIGDGFRVTVRDAANLPVGGSLVDLLFFGTVRPYKTQVAPTFSICPAAPGMRQAANAVGQAMFQARFGGYANAPAIQVRADGVLLATVLARSTDINADGTTAVADFNLLRINFLFNPAAQETDYDEDGITAVGDFNIFRKVFLNEIPDTPCP